MEKSLSLALLIVTLIVVATVGHAQEGQVRHGHGHGAVQMQPIGVRRIRIQRVRPGSRSTLPPQPSSSSENIETEDWGVRPVTGDPYTFFNHRPEPEQASPGGGDDDSEGDRREQLQRLRLFQLRHEYLRPISRLQQNPSGPRTPTSRLSNTNETGNATSLDGGASLTRKRNCTIQNGTSGQVEHCEDVNGTGADADASDYSQYNRHEWIVQERAKQTRLFMIQASILHKLGMQRQPTLGKLSLSDKQRTNVMQAYMLYGTGLEDDYDKPSKYTRNYNLLAPSCDLPCNTHRDWMDGSRFRLFFHYLPPHWKVTKIPTASLRLYKRPISDANRHRERGGRRRHQRRLHTASSYRQGEDGTEGVTGSPESDSVTSNPEEERNVRVSVYAYSRPVKARRKERVQLLDSVTVARSFEGWLKLDIRSAVDSWFQNPNKNYGLQVRVEDTRMRELDPYSVISPANCTLNNKERMKEITSEGNPYREPLQSINVGNSYSQKDFSLPYPLAVAENDANDTDAAVNQTTPYLEFVILGIPQSHPLSRRDTSQVQIACGRRSPGRTREHHSRAARSLLKTRENRKSLHKKVQYHGRGI